MTLFHRQKHNESNGDGDHSSEGKKEKGSWKKPANTAFKQQRLKAWQPILTPKTVLPLFFAIGVLFAPIGGLLIWGNSNVSQITIPYTQCDSAGTDFTDVSGSTYQLRSSDSKLSHAQPQWRFDSTTKQCQLKFELPADLSKPVFLYYKLTNFYQNHRRYVKSLDTDQLSGQARTAHDLDNSDCKPLGSIDGKPIYPCGLIANSLFNDTIGNLTSDSAQPYNFSAKNIAWPGERKKYTDKPQYTNSSDVVPPPNWSNVNYTSGNFPNLAEDERFQNWMRTAGLPTFSKLYGRNDDSDLPKGTYTINITMNYNVSQFGGTKSIVLSTVSWTGGKNAFLGWAYVGTAGLFVLLAIIGTIRHLVKPRRLGDMTLLSWNNTR